MGEDLGGVGVLRLEVGEHLGIGPVVAAQPPPRVDPLVAVGGHGWGRRGASGAGMAVERTTGDR